MYDSVVGNDVRNEEICDGESDMKDVIAVQTPSTVSHPPRKSHVAKLGLPPLLILSPVNEFKFSDSLPTLTKHTLPYQSPVAWAPPSSSSSSSQPSSLSSDSERDYDLQSRDIFVPRFTMTKEQQCKLKQKGSPHGVDQASSRDQSSSDDLSLNSPIKPINRLSVSMPSPSAMYSSKDQSLLPRIQFDGSEEDIFQIDSYNALQMCMSPQNNDKGFMDIRIPKFRFSSDNPFASRNSVRRPNILAAERLALGNTIVPFKVSSYNADYDTIRLKYIGCGKSNRRKSF
jgi:hypothetical protein